MIEYNVNERAVEVLIESILSTHAPEHRSKFSWFPTGLDTFFVASDDLTKHIACSTAVVKIRKRDLIKIKLQNDDNTKHFSNDAERLL